MAGSGIIETFGYADSLQCIYIYCWIEFIVICDHRKMVGANVHRIIINILVELSQKFEVETDPCRSDQMKGTWSLVRN